MSSLLGWGLFRSSDYSFYDLITSMVKLQASLPQTMTFLVYMKYFDARELPYLGSMNYLTKLSGWTFKFLHPYTVSITNKGIELDYEKIEDVFRVIDL